MTREYPESNHSHSTFRHPPLLHHQFKHLPGLRKFQQPHHHYSLLLDHKISQWLSSQMQSTHPLISQVHYMISLRTPRNFAQDLFLEKHELRRTMLKYSRKYVTASKLLMKMWFSVCSLTLWEKWPIIGTLTYHPDALEIGQLLRDCSWSNSRPLSIQQ